MDPQNTVYDKFMQSSIENSRQIVNLARRVACEPYGSHPIRLSTLGFLVMRVTKSLNRAFRYQCYYWIGLCQVSTLQSHTSIA